MLTGKRLRLTGDLIAIQGDFGEKRQAIKVPAGAAITVLGNPRENDPRLIDILWGATPLVAFVEDVERYGEEIQT